MLMELRVTQLKQPLRNNFSPQTSKGERVEMWVEITFKDL